MPSGIIKRFIRVECSSVVYRHDRMMCSYVYGGFAAAGMRFSVNKKGFSVFLSSAKCARNISSSHVKVHHLSSHRNKLFRLVNKLSNESSIKRFLSICSTFHQSPAVPGSLPDPTDRVDPFKLAEQDLLDLFSDIRKELWTLSPHLQQISGYYFDGNGKAFRPVIVVLMARALNFHVFNCSRLLETQRKMAIIAEMIHTASLVHDDVIDISDTRRGKSSVNLLWGQRNAILAGDFILAQVAQMLAKLGSVDVVHLLSQVLVDLIQGEFIQMKSTEDETERFSYYLQKTFKKTASLIAYTCKAAAVLCGASPTLQEAAFQYGRNVGIAFQLIDDLLDFISSQAEMGKPAAADLRLGLATAPVLFASQKYPELKPMILRRFCYEGDVEKAYKAVLNSDGLTHTKLLARKHCDDALSHISLFTNSIEKQALTNIVEKVLDRSK